MSARTAGRNADARCAAHQRHQAGRTSRRLRLLMGPEGLTFSQYCTVTCKSPTGASLLCAEVFGDQLSSGRLSRPSLSTSDERKMSVSDTTADILSATFGGGALLLTAYGVWTQRKRWIRRSAAVEEEHREEDIGTSIEVSPGKSLIAVLCCVLHGPSIGARRERVW